MVCAISASVMPSRAPRMASLIRCQLARAGQSDSIPQPPGPSSMQAVSAIGPSSAVITSATVTFSAGRASP
jgi:hypothetical protein